MGIRARSFAARLDDAFRISIAYRSANKALAILRFFFLLVREKPAVCYIFDMGYSGLIAAGLYRVFSRVRIIVDTGDSIYELSRLTGRGRVGLLCTKLLERFALFLSHRIVVRSHPHQEIMAGQGILADVVPDGVDLGQFYPHEENELRREYGLEGFTVIGVLGSLIWNSRAQACYGWELVELMDILRDWPVKGLVIGDGSGLAELKARCAAKGIDDRIVFLGRLPYDDLPRFLNMIDICLSTQTDDAAGRVRTTGKLPLYLACGRFVLASAVGEAARVLPREMLVKYENTIDTGYPARLAARVQELSHSPEKLRQPETSVAIARQHFDYDLLACRVRQVISGSLLEAGEGSPQPALSKAAHDFTKVKKRRIS